MAVLSSAISLHFQAFKIFFGDPVEQDRVDEFVALIVGMLHHQLHFIAESTVGRDERVVLVRYAVQLLLHVCLQVDHPISTEGTRLHLLAVARILARGGIDRGLDELRTKGASLIQFVVMPEGFGVSQLTPIEVSASGGSGSLESSTSM